MKLYKFQERGIEWLAAQRRAYLADQQGLGKTVQALYACKLAGDRYVEVACPASAVPVWEAHSKELAPEIEFTIRSYDSHVRRGTPLPAYDRLICDEGHYLKNPEAKRTRMVLKLANQSKRVWFLSGTPMPNHPGELYAPMRAVWPDVLQAHNIFGMAAFYDKFLNCVPTDYGIKVVGHKNASVLREILRTFMKRRTWESVKLDLPPMRIDTAHVTDRDLFKLLAEQDHSVLQAYNQLRRHLVDGHVPQGDDMHLATLRRIIGTAKALPAAKQIAEELSDNQYRKIVVMAYHRDVLDVLHEQLSKFGLVRIDGRSPKTWRAHAEHDFQNNPATRVFLGQLQAAGESITLTAAHEIALVEQMWSPGKNEQAIKRIHRIGQGHPCRVRLFTMPDTADDAVTAVLARKMEMQLDIINPLVEE